MSKRDQLETLTSEFERELRVVLGARRHLLTKIETMEEDGEEFSLTYMLSEVTEKKLIHTITEYFSSLIALEDEENE